MDLVPDEDVRAPGIELGVAARSRATPRDAVTARYGWGSGPCGVRPIGRATSAEQGCADGEGRERRAEMPARYGCAAALVSEGVRLRRERRWWGLEWVSRAGAAPAVGGGRRSREPPARGGPGGLTSGGGREQATVRAEG